MKRDFLMKILVVAILLGGLLFFSKFGGIDSLNNFFSSKMAKKGPTINNFEECAAAESIILESYPRQCRDSAGKIFTEYIGNELEKMDLIVIDSPRPNAAISSPLKITGRARGYWFFEASFPIKLVGREGNVLAYTIATAESEWMTEDFVPFSAELKFENINVKNGNLILEKDNPSGLPEHDDALVVPVNFYPDTF